jgi:Putative zinc-finger
MKCHQREKLFSFIHQMLNPQEAEGVRLHLAKCSECRQVVEEYRQLDLVLNDWTAPEPSPWFDAHVRARMAASGKEKSGFLGFGKVRTQVVGVLSVVLIVAGFIAIHQRQMQKASTSIAGPAVPQMNQTTPQYAGATEVQVQSLPAEEELKMDENLSVLEDYDMLANFEVLSELPQAKNN